MKLIVFDVSTCLAQFRKIYSTTSSLSYVFPPRTTIVGMVASMLGKERDSYYELFSTNYCKVGLQIKKPVRRIVQTVNYLNTDRIALSTLRGIGNPAQVRAEVVLADDEPFSELCYRIFFHHVDEEVNLELEKRLRSKKFWYPPSLGQLYSLADINYIDVDEKAEVSKLDSEVNLSTVIPRSIVESISPMEGVKILIEERVPVEFLIDRSNCRTESYLYEGSGKPLKVRIKGDVFSCIVEGKKFVGTFM